MSLNKYTYSECNEVSLTSMIEIQSEINDRLDPNHCKIHASNDFVLYHAVSTAASLVCNFFLENNNFSDYNDKKQHLTFNGKLFFEGIF